MSLLDQIAREGSRQLAADLRQIADRIDAGSLIVENVMTLMYPDQRTEFTLWTREAPDINYDDYLDWLEHTA